MPFRLDDPRDKADGISLGITIIVTDRYVTAEQKLYCAGLVPFMKFDGGLLIQEIVLSTGFQGDVLTECFYEDVSQALGMGGDNALTEESMYRSEMENGQWPKPTWHDVIMLRTLYDQRIRPGMHESQAMPMVRVIIGKLLEELNAVAE
jgi:hypothetical protein